MKGGGSLMIFCARATRGLRRPSLGARSERQLGHFLERGCSELEEARSTDAVKSSSFRTRKIERPGFLLSSASHAYSVLGFARCSLRISRSA